MKMFFAYLAEGEAFNATAHAREDELVLSASVIHSEGQLASATVEVEARAESIHALGRRAVISVDIGVGAVPVIVGALTGAPRGIQGERVTLEITARLDDWEAQRDALLATLKTAPHYDPLFDETGEQDDVLAGWPGLIAWDRVTGLPSFSHFLTGSALYTAAQPIFASVSGEPERPPVNAVEISLEASWLDEATIETTVSALPLTTIAPIALRDAWPSLGDDLGGGWIVAGAELSFSAPRPEAFDSVIFTGALPHHDATVASVSLRNNRSQARRETAVVRVVAAVQPLLPAVAEAERYGLPVVGSGEDLDPWSPGASYNEGDRVFYGASLYAAAISHVAGDFFDPALWTLVSPFSSAVGASFFGSDRGRAAIDHAIARAVARLTYAGRNYRVSFRVPLTEALGLSLSHEAEITDRRLPGGRARGKIISYGFTFGAAPTATIEIACATGLGGSSVPVRPAIDPAPVVLGPASYGAVLAVTPSLADEIEALRLDPTVAEVSKTVRIDAPAAPVARELVLSLVYDCGALDLPEGVTL